MAETITPQELRRRRLSAQLLLAERCADPHAAVSRVVAIQAQFVAAARLAVRVRTRDLAAADVDRAVTARRDVVRTWAMRGTLHMVAASDVRWLIGLLGPVFIRVGQRRRDQLGLDDATCVRALAALAVILAGSEPLTRAEVVSRLAAEGVRIDPATQAPPHLLMYAANRGLICRGPDADRDEPTYVLLDDWVPAAPPPNRDTALAWLARRYLAGYGPATVADFRSWSGLPPADANRAWDAVRPESVTVTCDGVTLTAPAGPPPVDTGVVPPLLLGAFDDLLLGYHRRDLILEPEFASRIQAGGGMIRSAVLVDGRIQGTWWVERGRGTSAIVVETFGGLDGAAIDGLAREAGDVGRFLGTPFTFRLAG